MKHEYDCKRPDTASRFHGGERELANLTFRTHGNVMHSQQDSSRIEILVVVQRRDCTIYMFVKLSQWPSKSLTRMRRPGNWTDLPSREQLRNCGCKALANGDEV